MPYFQRTTNLSLFYSLHGDPTKSPFLLIHGWTCDSNDWSFTIHALASDHHVITLDLRGHGHSSGPVSESYRIEDFADDAVALLTHLNITKDALVMGHSLGGIVASCLTALHPTLFKGLVVIDAPYWRTKDFWATTLPEWDELQNGLAFATLAFGNLMPPEGAMPAWLGTLYAIRMQAGNEHLIREALFGAFGEGGLGQREVHTELVKGRKVPRLAAYMNEDNCENEKGLGMGDGDEVVWVKDGGHWLHHIKVEEFNALLVGWLGRLEGE